MSQSLSLTDDSWAWQMHGTVQVKAIEITMQDHKLGLAGDGKSV